ncbi:MAG: GNAT family N-acetyltransferase [Rhodobacteraceae bacterium]|nr:GNAT family N-acetyltransferase [Paracoccaceae bacterium]
MTAAAQPEILSVPAGAAWRLALLNRDLQALHAAMRPDIFRAATSLSEIADQFAAALAGPAHFALLAVLEGQDAGYAFCELLETGGDAFTHARRRGLLHHIAVAPAFRRRGIATRLAGAAAERFRAMGATEWAATYWEFNAASAALLARMGLKPSLIRVEAPL